MIEEPPIDIGRLIGGDENVFQALFVDYYPSLISFAIKYVEREEAAQDIVQDVFVKVWETREKLEKIRHDATRSFTEEMDVVEMNEYIKEETFRIVMSIVEELPPGSRNVFSRAIQGYSAKEIADELGITIETVKKQKQNARRVLKERLGNLFMFFCL